MFSKILIANRGEVAVRIIKTCRRLGVAAAVVHSEADEASLAVELADEALAIGPPPAAQSYLVAEKILEAARQCGAEAIHPGFGFLSERADFAEACAAAGVVFIGPNPAAIAAMGDKIASKRLAAKAGVSTVPGHDGEIGSAAQAAKIAGEIGYPVMLKASAGGGGKGIRIAWNEAETKEGFDAVRAEAKSAFGDDRILIEKFIENPRHIEIQVMGDRHGNLIHLFERECSIQRRNQKVIEEAPSPLLDVATRQAMADQAIALARAVDYDSAGTVEFVAGQDRSFYFLEMNTRLQVEHPVTELISGVDLVEQMLRAAAGEPLGLTQRDLAIKGWAIESRVYAEDPYRRFLPSIGRLVRYRAPEEGPHGDGLVRNDAGVREGDEISMYYDPMIAKLCAWGPDRATAIHTMGAALEGFHIEGPATNLAFLAGVMDQPRFQSGQLSTRYIADEFPDGFQGLEPTPFQIDLMTAAAASMQRLLFRRARNGHSASVRDEWIVAAGRAKRRVRLSDDGASLTVELLDEGRALRLTDVRWRPGQALFHGVLDGTAFAAEVQAAAEGFIIRHHAARARVLVLTPVSAELHARLPEKPPADVSKQVISPMPGLIVQMQAQVGQAVREGETICIIEAMKMQNIMRAELDGVVKAVNAKAGDSVAADAVLVEFA